MKTFLAIVFVVFMIGVLFVNLLTFETVVRIDQKIKVTTDSTPQPTTQRHHTFYEKP